MVYEDKKKAVIHREIMDDIPSKYDKMPGSFIFDATRPAAEQFEKTYGNMEKVASLTDVENHHADDLDKFVEQRTGSVIRRRATHAVGTVEVEGNGLIQPGDLFQTVSGVQFEAIEEKLIQGYGQVLIRSVLPGDVGNVPSGQITEMPVSLAGINKVSNPSPTTEGYAEETDASLRERYYERIQTPATSGNVYHYRNWAKEVPGVGGVRIVSLWSGDNTVKVIIIDSNMQPATVSLVEDVQEHIDPGITGLGNGEAPIGAFCTVVSAADRQIHVQFKVVKEQGYDDQLIIDAVSANITEYLKRIAFKQIFISYAQIGGLILESEGVIDYSDLTVNEGLENIILTDEEVATLGGVIIDNSP